MRVTLIVKQDAGEGDHSVKKLVEKLEKAGHDVTACRRNDDWIDALSKQPDLVLIGGGDGTVGKVVRRLIGTEIPFAVLPLGTANNVAHELGWMDRSGRIIKRLEAASRRPFDVGIAAGPWGSWRFIESVGIGPFARTMALLNHTSGDLVDDPNDREKALTRDLKMLDAVLMESHAERCTIEVDGESIEDAVVLAEVMNIGRIGPNVRLAPDADCGDGVFDVVIATETDRERLHDYIAARLDGRNPRLSLTRRRANHVRITVESARLHVDDVLWPAADRPLPAAGAPFTVDVRMMSGALVALHPPEDD